MKLDNAVLLGWPIDADRSSAKRSREMIVLDFHADRRNAGDLSLDRRVRTKKDHRRFSLWACSHRDRARTSLLKFEWVANS